MEYLTKKYEVTLTKKELTPSNLTEELGVHVLEVRKLPNDNYIVVIEADEITKNVEEKLEEAVKNGGIMKMSKKEKEKSLVGGKH